ncbi:MAG: mitochondrial fission ELM1 family protein, partial [Beijerinckiaceae bacterium]|nr:mitochondrial fission ELM1 family protein [Beijerinckiaceae bacterium]
MNSRDKLPPGTHIRILQSQKTGHAVACLGLADALGVEPDITPVRPGKLFYLLAPWGPADPAFFSIPRPTADIVIASGKETVPVLRSIKRREPRVFTVYLGDPRTSHELFDLIWTPEHDSVSGSNIIKTLTAPHPHSAQALEQARRNPDTRMARLPGPRVACMIGGPSRQFAFGPADVAATYKAIQNLLEQGASIMVSPSRRTPQILTSQIMALAASTPEQAFVWDGTGDNPYRAMLALADAFLVTADSTNMIGEALVTGKPVHVLPLAGKAGKFSHFHAQLRKLDQIRNWNGTLESWPCTPVDATAKIAAEIVARYASFR